MESSTQEFNVRGVLRFRVLRAAALSLGFLPAFTYGEEGALSTSWYRNVVLIKAGEEVLDTGSYDPMGHAAPFLADINGDGLRDLVVGSFLGQFKAFQNTGTDKEPRFDGHSNWLMTPDQPARVPIACCVSSGPQLIDIDRDGILDLSAGSYAPGSVYWFKGLGSWSFTSRHTLVDDLGRAVFAHPEAVYSKDNRELSYASQIAWIDWNNDSLLDMLIGNYPGELFVIEQSARKYIEPVIRSQPALSYKNPREIRIDNEKAIPGHHSAPAVADWDGDGLWDILSGSENGAVYVFKNHGKLGAPEFRTRKELLPPGVALQAASDSNPERGVRSQIHVADYDMDGKVDLILGAWSIRQAPPRSNLTRSERKKMEAIISERAELDRKVGYDKGGYRIKHSGYQSSDEAFDRLQILEKELEKYLVLSSREMAQFGGAWAITTDHGHVWVYLRK